MKRLVLLGLVGFILMGVTPVLADGDFYVISGGAGAVGTKISSLPYTINKPGFYYVTGNLTIVPKVETLFGITVKSDNVTIDLMGFSLNGFQYYNQTYGIYIYSQKNVEIRNGTVRGWDTGISGGGSTHRVINVRVEGNNEGINLSATCSLVKGCVALDNYNSGIITYASTVSGNQVINCHEGIATRGGLSIVSNNMVTNCKHGIDANGTISGNVVNDSEEYGISCTWSGSLIGNSVYMKSGIGIRLSSGEGNVLVDQNNVTGSGTPYSDGNSTTVWGKNAGLPPPPP